MKQQTISDVEYSARKRKTKREEFLEIMDEIIPWEEWGPISRRIIRAESAAVLRRELKRCCGCNDTAQVQEASGEEQSEQGIL